MKIKVKVPNPKPSTAKSSFWQKPSAGKKYAVGKIKGIK
jgi:hypothetical protein